MSVSFVTTKVKVLTRTTSLTGKLFTVVSCVFKINENTDFFIEKYKKEFCLKYPEFKNASWEVTECEMLS